MRENNMKTTSASVTGGGEHSNDLERSIDWKQGLAIASGVPLLILPSLGYFPSGLHQQQSLFGVYRYCRALCKILPMLN